VVPVTQCPKRVLPTGGVEITASRNGVLSTVGWGTVAARQRIVGKVIVPGIGSWVKLLYLEEDHG